MRSSGFVLVVVGGASIGVFIAEGGGVRGVGGSSPGRSFCGDCFSKRLLLLLLLLPLVLLVATIVLVEGVVIGVLRRCDGESGERASL